MSELENLDSQFLSEADDDGLDIDAIFGDKSTDANPFENVPAAETPKTEIITLQNTEPPRAKRQTDTAEESEPDLFSAFAPKAEPKAEQKKQTQEAPVQTSLSLFDKPPVFFYEGAKENIEDQGHTLLKIHM